MKPGSLVKQARGDAGLSQSDLARRMGTTQSAVARLEAPGSNPRWSTVERAMNAMGLELSAAAAPRNLPDVDEDQIRSYLRMTPAQRLSAHQSAYENTRRALLNAG